MNKEKIEQHLNYLSMCQSKQAKIRCIERIYLEGINKGWEQSGECPKCSKTLPQPKNINDCLCEECKE